MTAWVCARCEAMVTTDSSTPTTPTRMPTRRVLGSDACSGVTSISVMSRSSLLDGVQPGVGARHTEHAASDDLHDFSECGDIGDELADLHLGAGELHDIAGGVRRQDPAAHPAQQR